MPRNGSGVYSKPFPDVEEGTTIESAVYNGFVGDVEQDLNTPRPITSGGTGANNARDAMINLGGEIAKQGPVDNYLAFSFVSGSFFSNASATNSPEGAGAAVASYVGVCYAKDDDNLFIEVRSLTDGKQWVQNKVGGSWGTWVELPGGIVALDAKYVKLSGDQMTGGLGFGSVAVTGADLTRHLALYSNQYGFNVTSGTLNVITDGAVRQQVTTTGTTVAGTLTSTGNIFFAPTPGSAPTVNGQMTFEAAGDSLIKVKYRGSDGQVRTANITLSGPV